jgi:hypothetical protein
MMTSIASITRLAQQARAFSVPLLVGGALAAGCGTVHAPVSSPAAGATAGQSTPSSSASATPVPTVTGGPVTAGATACVGWPSAAPHGKLTAFFQPVAVERCVTGFQEIQGKGEWETATLEKSTDNLAALIQVLLTPSSRVQPAVFCPEFAVIPPQVLLISSTGKQLIPQLPMGACGIADSRVLSTLASMSWQPVSVRLISKVTPTVTPRTLPGASIGPGGPKALRTGAAAAAD